MTTWKPSPNYTQGRTAKIDRIVMHWIVGNLAAADATFANPNSDVSAHYAIEGTKVHQYVKESDTAWHAGTAPMNARSIGIEHSAQPGRDASALTLETSAKLLAEISKRHNITLSRKTVLKHSEVVATQCPGTIPVDSIIKRANEILKGDDMVTASQASHLYRMYVASPVTEWGKTNMVGKMTWTEAVKHLKASKKYQALIVASGAGKLQAQTHLPPELMSAYKSTATVLKAGTYEVR